MRSINSAALSVRTDRNASSVGGECVQPPGAGYAAVLDYNGEGTLAAANVGDDTLSQRRASDACFADQAFAADTVSTAAPVANIAALVALVCAMNGLGDAQPAATESRQRRRLLVWQI